VLDQPWLASSSRCRMVASLTSKDWLSADQHCPFCSTELRMRVCLSAFVGFVLMLVYACFMLDYAYNVNSVANFDVKVKHY
jgi:hypothetical protein